MKHLVFFLLITLGFPAISQVDTAQVRVNREPDKKPRLDMLLVDLNWDRLVGWVGTGVEQKWHGRGIHVSLLFDQPIKADGTFSVAGGAGFTSHNYYTNAQVEKVPGTETAAFIVKTEAERERGKISLNYVDVPIELRFRTQEDKHGHRLKVAVGARGGYLINAHEKIIDGEGFKTKLFHYPHVAKFRYGPTFRFGYGSLMLTGYYSLSTFFQPGKGQSEMNALSLGITISPF